MILHGCSIELQIAAILTQLNQQNNEVPISFMSSNFKGAELNYHEVDKKYFSVFKTIKNFRLYL